MLRITPLLVFENGHEEMVAGARAAIFQPLADLLWQIWKQRHTRVDDDTIIPVLELLWICVWERFKTKERKKICALKPLKSASWNIWVKKLSYDPGKCLLTHPHIWEKENLFQNNKVNDAGREKSFNITDLPFLHLKNSILSMSTSLRC